MRRRAAVVKGHAGGGLASGALSNARTASRPASGRLPKNLLRTSVLGRYQSAIGGGARLLPGRRHVGRDEARPVGPVRTASIGIVDKLEASGVALRILDFSGNAVDTRGATGRLMLNMFAAMAQFEREMMLERQREGIGARKVQRSEAHCSGEGSRCASPL